MKIELLLQYAAVKNLKGKDYRVLLYILPRLSFGKFKKISQREISEALSMTKSNVSLAISSLIQNGILEADPEYRNTKKIRLHDYRENEVAELIENEVFGDDEIFDCNRW